MALTRILCSLIIVNLALLFITCEVTGETSDAKLGFEFTYSVNIDNIPHNSNSVDIWLPLPADNEYQKIIYFHINSELSYEIVTDKEYGNRFLHFSPDQNLSEPLDISIQVNAIRYEQDGWKQSRKDSTETPPELARYLLPDLLVPIDGAIKKEASQVTKSEMTSSEKIKALYYHLLETMKYDKSGTGWGNGDAYYACEARQGNCTDIHSLFIGMARSLGIPSRFVMGFSLPQSDSTVRISGYHCWAEFYLKDLGWVPVDISEAIKHPEKQEYFFGRLDSHRVAFTIGRDITLASAESSHALNYFIYPYVLVDGKPFTEVKHNFSCKQND